MSLQQVGEQTRLELARVIEEGWKHSFYFKATSRDTYPSNILFSPVEYCNLNHDERKRLAVVDYCALPIREILRGEEVTEIQPIVFPRIHLSWKIIAGVAGAVLAAVLLAPLLVALLTVFGVLLMASAMTLIDPVTVCVIEDGTPEGLWLELMFYHEPPAFSISRSAKR